MSAKTKHGGDLTIKFCPQGGGVDILNCQIPTTSPPAATLSLIPVFPEQASALISSPNVSKVDGGVHGHRAFVFLSPYIPMVDRGALPRLTLNDAIYVCVHV